jgi:hypothetical protein
VAPASAYPSALLSLIAMKSNCSMVNIFGSWSTGLSIPCLIDSSLPRVAGPTCLYSRALASFLEYATTCTRQAQLPRDDNSP